MKNNKKNIRNSFKLGTLKLLPKLGTLKFHFLKYNKFFQNGYVCLLSTESSLLKPPEIPS